ncbi:MAG: hypothetical protein U0903_22350 [Planctomycetales bacterium]
MTGLKTLNRRLFVVLSAVALLWTGCGPPQVLNSDESLKSLDALWTAVTSQKRDLLTTAAKDLKKIHDDKKMSDAGWSRIDAIIKQAESGDWQGAAKKLQTFIKGQRKQNH